MWWFNLYKTIFTCIYKGVSTAVTWVVNKINSGTNSILAKLQPIKNFFVNLWDTVKGILTKIADKLSPIFTPIKAIIEAVTGKVVNTFSAGYTKGAGYFGGTNDQLTGLTNGSGSSDSSGLGASTEDTFNSVATEGLGTRRYISI